MTQNYDLVIRGGTIVDGTSSEPYQGDLAIKGDRIVAVGMVEGSGAEEIDATGLLVTPGFVDVHTHYDGQITWENTLAPSSDHGVTTVVMGNCGVGFAPVRAGDQQMAIKLMEGVEDVPEVVMAEGVPWNWETFPDYLDALDARHSDIDFATQLPHSTLRVYVMGERGANLEPPTADDLARMRGLVTESIKAGALGVSTSRQLAHRFRDGRPAPSTMTEVDELKALASGLKDADGGVFQLIPNTDKPADDEYAIIHSLHEVSGRPVNFSLFPGNQIKGGWHGYLNGLLKSAEKGEPITGQYFPRPTGMLFGLDLSYNPFSLNPSYREIASLPLADKVKAMRDPEFRARLIAEEPEDPNPFFIWVVKQTEMLFPLGDPPNYNPSVDDSFAARARRLGVNERELMYEALLEQNGKALIYCPLGGHADGRMDLATDLFGVPGTVLGLGDGGAHYGMICDAAFTTFVLQQYVREVPKLTIEKAVSMLSREPAATVGLLDRGILKTGYKADVNIIDMENLSLATPRVKYDLPAGGRRLSQKAQGYEATIVSGVVTYRRGRSTGALPGRLVRHARQAPAA